jgi:hypothetical protein
MVREQFIATYVATFLASYSAVHYIENCQRGWKNADQPVEDAHFLAEQAWDELLKQDIDLRSDADFRQQLRDIKPPTGTIEAIANAIAVSGPCPPPVPNYVSYMKELGSSQTLITGNAHRQPKFMSDGDGVRWICKGLHKRDEFCQWTPASYEVCVVCGNGEGDWLHSAGIAGDDAHEFKVRCNKTMCTRKECLDCYPEKK